MTAAVVPVASGDVMVVRNAPFEPYARDNPKGFQVREALTFVERSDDDTEDDVFVAFSSETPVARYDYMTGETYLEVLDHSPGAVDLSYAKDGLPFCLDHRLSQMIGLAEDVRIDGDRLGRCRAVQGEHPDAKWAFKDMRRGIRKKISFGYWPGDNYEQTKRADGTLVRVYRGWMPFEVSSVPVPADYDKAGVGRSANGRAAVSQDDSRTGAQPNTQEHRMESAAQVAAAPATPAAAPAPTRAEIELARQEGIRQIASESGQSSRLMEWLMSPKTVDEVRAEAFAAVRASAPQPTNAAAPAQVLDVHNREQDKPFSSFVDFMRATKRAVDGVVDPRLHAQRGVATGMGIGNDADGGFMVPEQFAQGIVTRAFEGGRILSRIRPIPVSGNQYHITAIDETSRATGSRMGGVRAYRIGENDSATASKPKTRRVTLDVTKKLAVLMYASEEQLEDAPATDTLLTQAASEEITFSLEREIIEGIGGAECEGILNSGALVTQPAEGGQTADTVNAQNVIKMNARLWSRSHPNAVWLINQSVLAQLPLMTLSNQPVYLPPAGLSTQGFGTLFGKPIEVVEYASAIGDVGDIMLVDLSQYLLADKARAAMARSIHVRFVQGEEAFRLIYRVDGKPLWNAALTPFKGSDTVSPFVTLAAR